jgi:hypothetical protein
MYAVLRYAAMKDHVYVTLYHNGAGAYSLALKKLVDWSETTIDSQVVAWSAGDELEVSVDAADAISVCQNDVLRVSGTVADFDTNTLQGIKLDGSAGLLDARWDDYSVQNF